MVRPSGVVLPEVLVVAGDDGMDPTRAQQEAKDVPVEDSSAWGWSESPKELAVGKNDHHLE